MIHNCFLGTPCRIVPQRNGGTIWGHLLTRKLRFTLFMLHFDAPCRIQSPAKCFYIGFYQVSIMQSFITGMGV